MYWWLRPWRHFADFSGRSPRREYWLFVLQTYVLIFLPVILLFLAADPKEGVPDAAGTIFLILFLLFFAVTFIPGLAVAVRRLHDQDKPGILLLLGFVPFIGGFILLFLMLMDGSEGENRYGPNPLDREGMATVSEVFD